MTQLHPNAILTNAQMAAADRATIAAGTKGFDLMSRAGEAVAKQIEARFSRQPVLVMVGPGNNGGDGFVIAEYLRRQGWQVRVGLLGEKNAMAGDAAHAAENYEGELHPLHPFLVDHSTTLVVDALFGTGLSRDVTGHAAEVLTKIARRGVDMVAVDIPSGVSGDTGEVLGAAAPAVLTITFHRKKRGHVLYPGRGLCGEVQVIDIGIRDAEEDVCIENSPELWGNNFPWPAENAHKYDRGHALVQGGAKAHTGAARLASRAALRTGAGLVTLVCDTKSLPVYAASCEAVMTQVVESDKSLAKLLEDDRITGMLVGPGGGVDDDTKIRALACLAAKKPLVLDADGISIFAKKPRDLFDAIDKTPCVLTPHEGEFKRLFPDIEGDKVVRAELAAVASGAVIVLKGADTVIASPDGQVVVNACGSPHLATAGSGDVLAGILLGLLAQGMNAFDAACAGVWMHGMMGAEFGPGLIAEDLPEMLPEVLHYLRYTRPVNTAANDE